MNADAPDTQSAAKLVSSARQLSLGIIGLGALAFYLWTTATDAVERLNEFHKLELTVSAIRTAQAIEEGRTGEPKLGDQLHTRRSLRLSSDPGSPCEVHIDSGPAGRVVFGHRTIRDPEFIPVDGRRFLLIRFDYLCDYYSWGIPGETGGLQAAILVFRDADDQPWWVAMYEPELQRFEPRLTRARTEIVLTEFSSQGLLQTNLEDHIEIIERLVRRSDIVRYERIDSFLRAKVQRLTGRVYSNAEEALRDVLTRGEFKPSLYGVSINQGFFERTIPALLVALCFAFWHRTRRLAKTTGPLEEPWVILRPDGFVEALGALVWAISLPIAVAGGFLAALKGPDSEAYTRLSYALLRSKPDTNLRASFLIDYSETYWSNLTALAFSWASLGIALTFLALAFVLLSVRHLSWVNRIRCSVSDQSGPL